MVRYGDLERLAVRHRTFAGAACAEIYDGREAQFPAVDLKGTRIDGKKRVRSRT